MSAPINNGIDMSARASELKDKLIGLKHSRGQTNNAAKANNNNANAATLPGPWRIPTGPASSKLAPSQAGQTSAPAPQTPLQARHPASIPHKTPQQPMPLPLTAPSSLSRDADLQDWLVMTGYYDKATRTRKLKLFRRTRDLEARTESLDAQRQEIEAEKARIEAEQQRLFEEGGVPYTSARPEKRSMAEDDRYYHEPKRPRVERTPPPEQRRGNYQEPRRGSHPMDYGRDYFPPRDQRMSPPPYHRRDYSPRRAPPAPPLSGDWAGSDRRYVNPPQQPRQGLRPPKPVDLGDKGDTRFFILKSFNIHNVDQCMADGLWATTISNADILTKAFAECKNVILFFSINGSRSFQGYARMQTAPDPQTRQPRWYSDINWCPSDPFTIDWLSKTPIPFFHIHHLTNHLNDNLSVVRGRDGQEIDEENGRKLLKEMRDFSEMAAAAPDHPGTREDDSVDEIIKREPREW